MGYGVEEVQIPVLPYRITSGEITVVVKYEDFREIGRHKKGRGT